MNRCLLTLTILLCSLGLAQAQFPGGGGAYPYPYAPSPYPTNFLPNFYNRQNQPLSPYLNLLRGGSPGVNYFYGVRPGLPSGGMLPNGTMGTMGGSPPMQSLMAGAAQDAGPGPDVMILPIAGQPIDSLPPSGRPAIFVGPVTFGPPMTNRPGGAAPRPGVLGNQAPPAFRGARGNRP